MKARAVTAVVAGAALLVSAVPAQAAPRKTVQIGDNYYAPKTLKVKPGTTVTWKWPGFEMAGDVHDVKLKSAPKGVKKFHSDLSASDYSFARTLTKPGKYVVICTIHAEMRQTIRVKR